MTRGLTARRGRSWNVPRWLTGFGLGLIGDQIFYLALAWTAAQIASPAMAGLIVGIGAAPRALLLLVGGALSDRLGARRVALASDLLRLGTMLVFAIVAATSVSSVVMLVLVALIFGTIDAFFLPSVGALPTRIVAREQIGRTQLLRSVVQRLATVLGPPLGGFLLSTFGFVAAVSVNAALFALSCVALYLTQELRAREQPSPADAGETANTGTTGLIHDAWEGLRYTLSQPGLRVMLALITIGEFAYAGPFTTGLTLLAVSNDWTAADVGALLAVFAAGAGTTALVLAIKGTPRRAGQMAVIAIIAMGPATAAIGLADSVAAAAVAAVVAGACSGVCATLLATLFLTQADTAHAGRVMAALSLATFGAAPLSYLASGVLAEALSPGAVFVVAGTVLLFTGTLGAASRTMRDQRL